MLNTLKVITQIPELFFLIALTLPAQTVSFILMLLQALLINATYVLFLYMVKTWSTQFRKNVPISYFNLISIIKF